MEDTMCWEMDYEYFAAQQKARDKRTEAIDKLLKDANQTSEQQDQPAKTDDVAVKDPVAAK
jgi:hypothetical protein